MDYPAEWIEIADLDRAKRNVIDGTVFENKLDEMGGMSATEYLRQRKTLAEELGVPCHLLDEERKRREKKDDESAVMQAHWTDEPWHEPVNGRELIGDIVKRIRRHVMMSESSLRAAALWVPFAWMHESAGSFSHLSSEQPRGRVRQDDVARPDQPHGAERHHHRRGKPRRPLSHA
jgi:hypothetical protein